MMGFFPRTDMPDREWWSVLWHIVASEEENLENNDRMPYEVIQGTEGPEARNVSRV